MKTLLVVGASPNQVPAIRVAGELGYEVVAVDVNSDAVGFQYADHGEVVSNDVVNSAVDLSRQYDVDGALTMAADIGVPTVAAVRAELGLPGVGPEIAQRATHKGVMMKVCEAAETPVPDSIIAADLTTAETFFASQSGPIVVKPTDSGGQRGVRVIRQPAELEAAFEAAVEYASDERVLLQEFVEGPEINVTTIVTDGEVHFLSLSNRITADSPHFGIAIEHISPPKIDQTEQRAVRDVTESAIEAIGIDNGIAYPQIIVGPDGPQLIEIAARVPGGQMREVAMYRSGVDQVRAAIHHALGTPFSIADVSVENPHSAVSVQFFTELNVTDDLHSLRRVQNFEEARSLPNIEDIDIWLNKGDTIPELADSTARFGYVIAIAEDRAAAHESAERATSVIEFV